MLEHGLSSYPWLNGMLDGGRDQHLQKWGCEWNRDIDKLIEKSGMQVESKWRWHFGTTFFVRAKPGARLQR